MSLAVPGNYFIVLKSGVAIARNRFMTLSQLNRSGWKNRRQFRSAFSSLPFALKIVVVRKLLFHPREFPAVRRSPRGWLANGNYLSFE
jgi:hypothetical protein